MLLRRLLLLAALPGAGLLLACGSGDVETASGGGGSGGETNGTSNNVAVATATTGPVAATSATSSGTGAGGAAIAASTSSSTGASPANCDALSDCGNFGEGCVACAIQDACATEYANCANDPACESYATCVTDCPSKSDSCVLGCATQSPGGSDTYKSLNQCVVCQACATSCADATEPNTCN
jgi:hypothetical protein